MSKFYRSAALLVLALGGLLASAAANAEMKVGVVDFNRLIQESPQAKQLSQTLENEFGPRRRELLSMQNDVKAKDDKLQKEGPLMAEADRVKAEKALRDEQRELSRKGQEFQDDASQRRNEELNKLQRFVASEIATYSSAQGFDLVLGEGVFYSKSSLDITTQVLDVLKTKPAAIPAMPAAPAKPATK
ncbi:MAG TPA: OmpH family outer membrane protein [Steroidobacteraceae bacterium]|jgi:outer membrane protein